MKSKALLLSMLFIVLFNCSSEKDEQTKVDNAFIKGKEAYLKRDFALAEKFFSDVLSKDKENYNARLMIAKVYFYKKDFTNANKELEILLSEDPDNVGGLYWHAKILLFVDHLPKEDNENEAKNKLIRLLEIDSSHTGARALLALIYEKEGKFKEALNQYEMILDSERQIIDSRANLSILYKKIGLKQKALDQINIAIETAGLINMNQDVLKKIKEEIGK